MRYVILYDCVEGLPIIHEEFINKPFPGVVKGEYPYPFRLLDGDGNHCYYGRNKQGPDQDTDAAFAPLDWGKADSGCTTIEYQNQYGEWEEL